MNEQLEQQMKANDVEAAAVRPAQGVPEEIVLKQQAAIMVVQEAIVDAANIDNAPAVAGFAEGLVNLVNGLNLLSAPEEPTQLELSDQILERVTLAVNEVMDRREADLNSRILELERGVDL